MQNNASVMRLGALLLQDIVGGGAHENLLESNHTLRTLCAHLCCQGEGEIVYSCNQGTNSHVVINPRQGWTIFKTNVTCYNQDRSATEKNSYSKTDALEYRACRQQPAVRKQNGVKLSPNKHINTASGKQKSCSSESST